MFSRTSSSLQNLHVTFWTFNCVRAQFSSDKLKDRMEWYRNDVSMCREGTSEIVSIESPCTDRPSSNLTKHNIAQKGLALPAGTCALVCESAPPTSLTSSTKKSQNLVKRNGSINSKSNHPQFLHCIWYTIANSCHESEQAAQKTTSNWDTTGTHIPSGMQVVPRIILYISRFDPWAVTLYVVGTFDD